MAMHARPVPNDPYNPLPESDTVRHPSPFVPIRIPIFALVLLLNDWIVRVLSVGGRSGARNTHRRAQSDDAESVEQGESIEMHSKKTGPIFGSNRSASSRVNIGRRKKLD